MPLLAETLTEITPFVSVNAERCVGCTECLKECPRNCLALNFRRWVVEADSTNCSGCRQCQRVCPYQNIMVTGPFLGLNDRVPGRELEVEKRMGNFAEVHQSYTVEEAVQEASRCLKCPRPRCRDAGCPAHNDIPSMNAAIRERDFPRALKILSATTNLPAICSRVCNQAGQCEGSCVYRREGGQAVAIGKLERFVDDWARENNYRRDEPVMLSSGYRVAVVGAGPAALAAAEDLARSGHSVTIVETLPTAGGILAWGIPDFILPSQVVAAKVEELRALGVQFHLETRVGSGHTIESLFRDGFDAVFLAVGAEKDNTLNLPGSDLKGIGTATSFLTAGKLSLTLPSRYSPPPMGENVLVIGAGNTAMDVARTAKRLGAKNVTAIDILPEALAPVRRDELETARAEGVEVRFAVSTKSFSGQGKVEMAELVRMEAHRDKSGKIRPSAIPGSEFTISVDTVVFAMGYRTSQDVVAGTDGVTIDSRGAVATLGESGHTSREGIWAAGDIVTGPGTVVRAMVAGKGAARSIDQNLKLKEMMIG